MRKGIILVILGIWALGVQAQNDSFYKKLPKNCPLTPLEVFFGGSGELKVVCASSDSIFIYGYDSFTTDWSAEGAVGYSNQNDINSQSMYHIRVKIIPFYLKGLLYLSVTDKSLGTYEIYRRDVSNLFQSVLNVNNAQANFASVHNDTAYLGGSFVHLGTNVNLVKFGGDSLEAVSGPRDQPFASGILKGDTILGIGNSKCYYYKIKSDSSGIYYDFGANSALSGISMIGNKLLIGSAKTNLPVFRLEDGSLLDTLYYPGTPDKGNQFYSQEFVNHRNETYRIMQLQVPNGIFSEYRISRLEKDVFRPVVPPKHREFTDSVSNDIGSLFSNGIRLYYAPRTWVISGSDSLNIAEIRNDSLAFFTNDTIRLRAFEDLDTNGVFSPLDLSISGYFEIQNEAGPTFSFTDTSLLELVIPDYMELIADAKVFNSCLVLPFSGFLRSDNTFANKTRDTLSFPFVRLQNNSRVKGEIFRRARARLLDTITNEFRAYETSCPTGTATVFAKLILGKNTNFVSSQVPIRSKVGDTVAYRLAGINRSNPAIVNFETSYSNTDFKIGDKVTHFFEIYADSGYTDKLSTDSMEVTVVYSYDPNEKIAEPNGVVTKDVDFIKYTIHFQNEGTDVARKVIIKDTIDTRMPVVWFRMISSSHPYTVTIRNNVVTWTFDNINLAAKSEDIMASQGYVSFEAKVNTSLAIGDSIRNKAAIYFDLNDAIITNYAVIRRQDEEDFVRPVIQFDDIIKVYPNPTQGQIQIKNLKSQEFDLVLYDLNGKHLQDLIIAGHSEQFISLYHLPKGIYFLQLRGSGITHKLLLN